GIDDLLGGGQEIVPSRGGGVGHAGLARQARMPARADHVEQERPAIELAVDRALLADRRDNVVDHLLRDVLVPRLDDVALDHLRHLHERRLPDIDVPGALLALGLGHEALDAEALDRRDLIVDARELGVHLGDGGMEILDPLIERGGQRPVSRQGRSDSALRYGPDAGQAETGHQAAGEKLTPVDVSLPQLPESCLLQDVFLFLAYAHRSPPYSSDLLSSQRLAGAC